jgi:hypothetical protein
MGSRESFNEAIFFRFWNLGVSKCQNKIVDTAQLCNVSVENGEIILERRYIIIKFRGACIAHKNMPAMVYVYHINKNFKLKRGFWTLSSTDIRKFIEKVCSIASRSQKATSLLI